MAEDDIYGNQKQYEKLKSRISEFAKRPRKGSLRKYWIKDRRNLKYFRRLLALLEARDASYIRRVRLLRSFLFICHNVKKDLSRATRKDIDQIMIQAHATFKSPRTKSCFVIDLRFLWRQLFPEKDERGRIDDSIIPYVVRHVSGKVDKSREKMRTDRFSLEEFERLVQSFSHDPRMQCLLTVSLESLGRPQELLGRRMKDVELHDNYAKIFISEHGKEGIGFLRVIDSYFYLAKWINSHPLRHDPNAFLFVNMGNTNQFKQMRPHTANKLIRKLCRRLGIAKPITLYSLKRNGVTMRRLAGESDIEIQHAARWSSTKQLHTYDLSSQEDSFKRELIKRGKIKPGKGSESLAPRSRPCAFCGTENGLAEAFCSNCQRPLNRDRLLQEEEAKQSELSELKVQMAALQEKMTFLARYEQIQRARQ